MKRVFVILSIFALLGCASGPTPEVRDNDIFEGFARDASFGQAILLSRVDAVRKGVISIIGPAAEEKNRSKLDTYIYATNRVNAFVDSGSQEVLEKGKVGEDYTYSIRIRVKLDALSATMKAQGIIGGATQAESSEGAATRAVVDAIPEEKSPAAALVEEDPVPASKEETQLIQRYIKNMTFMVYFSENTATDPFLLKAAVASANSFLASKSVPIIDAEQIEKLKADQQLVYEEETGAEVSLIQWIAQKLNADVYIEIEAVTDSSTQSGRYYGNVNLTIKIYEASTGTLLGSQPAKSQRAVSTTSERDAVMNAMTSIVYNVMPIVYDQARNYMAQTVSRGIRYEVVLQGTSDARTLARFRSKLQNQVRDLRTLSSSAEETKLEVFFFGTMDDLELLIYDTADTIPGYEGLVNVMMRGKTIVFDTGM